MPNLIDPVQAILKQVRTGYPEGIEPIVKQLPVLFERINELESALAPFARAALNAGDNNGLPMIQVYLSDAKNAFNALDSRQSVPVHANQEQYLPAE